MEIVKGRNPRVKIILGKNYRERLEICFKITNLQLHDDVYVIKISMTNDKR